MNGQAAARDDGLTRPGAPLVSVVIPAYNAAATVRETIGSVLAQGLQDFEIIVVDDGSTDTTREVVAGLRDPRIRLLSFANAGPAASRNRGIAAASGELLAFLDADDLWRPDKLAMQVEALRRAPAAALAYSFTDYVDEAGRFLKHGAHQRIEGEVYEALIRGNFLENGSTPLVRRAALREVGTFDESLRGPEDWDLWLRLAHRFPFACVPEAQVLYRVRPGSISSNTERQIAACLVVLDRAIGRLAPGPAREWLARGARADLYRTMVTRLVETSTTRADGLRAARFWWLYATTVPRGQRAPVRSLLLAAAILAIVVLPPRGLAWLRVRAVAALHRGRARRDGRHDGQRDDEGAPPAR